MNKDKFFHLKGALYLIGAIACFLIAYFLVHIGVKDTYWIQSDRLVGTATISGLVGTIGGCFLLAFYFGYVLTLLDLSKVKKLSKFIKKVDK